MSSTNGNESLGHTRGMGLSCLPGATAIRHRLAVTRTSVAGHECLPPNPDTGCSSTHRPLLREDRGRILRKTRGSWAPARSQLKVLLLIDDPLKDAEEARSEGIRRSLQNWYAHVAYTRLQPESSVILIMTRWHEDDLAGWLLREHSEEGWDVVSLPAIAEKQESFRGVGEALWPERFPIQVPLLAEASSL